MTKPNYTDITIVLDESGSMGSHQRTTIESFNKFLRDQKEVEVETTISLVKFSYGDSYVYNAIKLEGAPDLGFHNYSPNGGTALYDAVGKAIDATGARLRKMKEKDRPERVLFIVFTDGEENSSKEVTSDRLREMIEHQRDRYQWTFLFFGTNQDAILEAAKIGVQQSNAMYFMDTATGHTHSHEIMSEKVRGFRSAVSLCSAQASASFTADDRQKAGGISPHTHVAPPLSTTTDTDSN